MSISRASRSLRVSRRSRLALLAAGPALIAAAVAAGSPATAAPQALAAAPAHGASSSVHRVSPLHATTVHLKGTKGLFSWDVAIPRFSGSARAGEVNRRVRASAVDTINGSARDAAGNDAKEELDGVSAVTTNDGRTVQVRLDYDDYVIGAAHPTDVVDTVALVAATGAPITLAQVFTSRTAAFTALAPQIEKIATAKGELITEHSGLAPMTSNWSAWQSTPAGMVFAFQDYQLGGHGVRTYTMPWAVVRPLMTPSAKALLAP